MSESGESLSALRRRAAMSRWARYCESAPTAEPVPEPTPSPEPIKRAPAKKAPVKTAPVPPKVQAPYDEIVAAYHEAMPMCPRVRVMSANTKGYINARWLEDPVRQDINWWTQYFKYAAQMPFLRGDNSQGWVADFRWLIGVTNMEKVINGRYEK